MVIRPSPQEVTHMELVMEWIAWLRGQPVWTGGGNASVKRIVGWSLGMSYHMLAWRERCHKNTIPYRIDKSMRSIAKKFQGTLAFQLVLLAASDLPKVDETSEPPKHGTAFGPPCAPLVSGELPEPGKVFIAEKGFMVGGKPYRSAQDDNVVRKRRR
jgi:hypothetical protein